MVDESDPLAVAFDDALEQVGIKISTSAARRAAGRLAALQLANQFGIRPARRILASERDGLVQKCAHSLPDERV